MLQQKNEKWNVDRYLKRIYMERPDKPNLNYLNRLIEQHLIHIPFEDLDLFLNRADISLDLDRLYEKVVIRHRGGYCFELNKLFHFLLKDLGFDTYPCFCRVQEGQEKSCPISHRGNIVLLDGKMLFCDVGYGNSMSRGALELKEHIFQKQGTDTYWFKQYDPYWFDMFRLPQDLVHEDGTVITGEPRIELRICIASAEEIDFVPLNAVQNGSDSEFRKQIMVGRLTEDGAVAINEKMIFSRTERNHKTRRKIKDNKELFQILKDEFGIDIT